jgi:hypothetical protein
LEKIGHNTAMPRPRKEGRLRMDAYLRIPMTSEQKALVQEATRDEPEGVAAWVRAVVLQAARERIAQRKSTKERGDIGGSQHGCKPIDTGHDQYNPL